MNGMNEAEEGKISDARARARDSYNFISYLFFFTGAARDIAWNQ